MKCLNLLLFSLYFTTGFAQPGLQGIWIEPYYVTSKADRQAFNSSGPLEEGAVTYRIYVDLEPGYRFQAAYGSPEHPLEISSSRFFFNHNHSGNVQPDLIPERDLACNITMLDSWLSVGAATENHLGIPRKYDFLAQDANLRFQDGFLANTIRESESDTGPLTTRLTDCDGLARYAVLPTTTLYNLDSAAYALGSVTRCKRFVLDNGAWACMGKGSVGADSTSGNHVLIAQLTTAGSLNYRLNVMIGTPEGKSIRYVYDNAQDQEILFPALAGKFDSGITNPTHRRSKKKK